MQNILLNKNKVVEENMKMWNKERSSLIEQSNRFFSAVGSCFVDLTLEMGIQFVREILYETIVCARSNVQSSPHIFPNEAGFF